MNRSAIILLGSLILAFLIIVCIISKVSGIQDDIQTRTSKTLQDASINWATALASGRDVLLTGIAPSEMLRQQAEDLAKEVEGVVKVENQISIANIPFKKPAISTPVTPLDSVPYKNEKTKVIPKAEPKSTVVEKKSPIDQKITDSVSCEIKFNQIITTQQIKFSTDSANIESQTNKIIKNLLKFLNTCPNSIIEIAGHSDSRGDEGHNYLLSKQRAQTVANILVENKIRADLLQIEGYGETKPLSSNETEQGRADNRRIELNYLREGK